MHPPSPAVPPATLALPDAVLFDCDGVLADSEAVINRIIADEVSAKGWEMTAEESQRRFLGLALPAMLPIIEARVGPLDEEWVAGVVSRCTRAMTEEMEPVPGALAALETIRAAGLPVAVASNSSRVDLATKLRRLGIAHAFSGRIFSYQDVPAPKPAPDIYRAAAEACGADAHRCVVVEDSVVGTRAGRAAGCRVLGFAHGPVAAQALAEAGAEVFWEMSRLPQLLGVPAGAS
jgi:HAD superfamily hydrolase (TIGR01509 family)